MVMRSAGNFSSEWGYLAPAPSFFRTARIVLVATAIGATAGAGVVLSLVDHPAAEVTQTSMAAHAIVTSVHAAIPPSLPPGTPLASTQPMAAAVTVSGAPAAQDTKLSTQAPIPAQAALAVRAPDIPQVQVQTPAATATPSIAAPSASPLASSGAAKSDDAHDASAVLPSPSPPGVAVLSEAPPSADVGTDVSTAPVAEAPKKPIKGRVTGPAVANNANAKNKPDPGLGSVLRHLFSARAGTSYYPN